MVFIGPKLKWKVQSTEHIWTQIKFCIKKGGKINKKGEKVMQYYRNMFLICLCLDTVVILLVKQGIKRKLFSGNIWSGAKLQGCHLAFFETVCQK